jgi:hypothetical protein
MASVDFFTVPTIRFQIPYVFLVLAHDRRQIVHFNVTTLPTAERPHNNCGRHFRSTSSGYPLANLLRSLQGTTPTAGASNLQSNAAPSEVTIGNQSSNSGEEYATKHAEYQRTFPGTGADWHRRQRRNRNANQAGHRREQNRHQTVLAKTATRTPDVRRMAFSIREVLRRGRGQHAGRRYRTGVEPA